MGVENERMSLILTIFIEITRPRLLLAFWFIFVRGNCGRAVRFGLFDFGFV